ncbi:fibroblast growth factor receptor 1-like [Dendronephthya gigantea]|uniref:fibroblast growth factor receptor 1-like n=1 Tax=Dendronephthya gigantea TaxID=151771 RepID=UPI001069C319|nr:fibroblast growth factor receptor 1-like [Dendronephthya gigantea]
MNGKAFLYPFIKNKPNSSIEFDATVKLICEISDKGYSLAWFKGSSTGGKPKEIASDNLNFREKGRLTRSLTINKFGKSESGLYICVAERSLVKWTAEDSVFLASKEYVKPTFVISNVTSNVVTLEEGESWNMTIMAIGYPKPRVKCELHSVKSDADVNDIVNNSKDHFPDIYISNVKYSLHDGIRIHCVAENMNGKATANFSLNILVKPKINVHEPSRNKMISVKENSPLNLVCKVDEGNPSPTIRWKYRNEKHGWSDVTARLRTAIIVRKNTLRVKGQMVYKMLYKCVANNSLGVDAFTWDVLNETNREALYLTSGGKSLSESYLIVIIVVSCIVALLILCFGAILYRRKKMLGGFYLCTMPHYRDYIQILDQGKFIHEQTNKLPYLSEWEFPRENILLENELGSGAFGVVYFARAVGMAQFQKQRNALRDAPRKHRFSLRRVKKPSFSVSINDGDVVDTAVKTLKGNYTQTELSDLISEIKILIHVGEHENVLRILGASTKVDTDLAPLIILEYCPHGNLKEFLRTRRDIYEPEWKDSIDNGQLTVINIANFALHIAKGMEYLLSRKCIHRDLAARNVLISQEYIAKISDFGLARDVYYDLEYVKKTSGLLPIKWMAIEAIQDRVFNEKTDVWSYGIVLWEMFTLGGTPYPNLDPASVLQTLLDEKRMEPPMHCPQEITNIMSSCWYKSPLKRPTFSELVCQLQKLCGVPKSGQLEVHYQNAP